MSAITAPFIRLARLSHKSYKLCSQSHPYRLTRSRRISSTPYAPMPPPHEEEEDNEEVDIQDPGLYDMILPPEPYVWGVSHITPRPVPPHITRPPYVDRTLEFLRLGKDPARADELDEDDGDGRIKLGTVEEVKVRNAAKLAKKALAYAGSLVKPGVTTDSIDAALHEFIISHNAYPSPLLYTGFPRSCCTSVNNVVTHGIPDDRPLQEGDIVNIDVTVYLDGYHGDTSRTFSVGRMDDIAQSLVSITNEAHDAAIGVCGPGKPFRGIARAIYDTLHRPGAGTWSICAQFTGHGIGRMFHRPPWIFHDVNEEPGVMLPGHCFTIEPCVVVGSNPRAWIFPDGWTASTVNGARSAQAEDMILITENGADILTRA